MIGINVTLCQGHKPEEVEALWFHVLCAAKSEQKITETDKNRY